MRRDNVKTSAMVVTEIDLMLPLLDFVERFCQTEKLWLLEVKTDLQSTKP